MPPYQQLKNLGLSKTAVACYRSLVEDGSATPSELAERLSLPRTGLYRVLKQMDDQGFVIGPYMNLRPKYYHARPLDQALEYFFKYQRHQVKRLYWYLANKRTVGNRDSRSGNYRYQFTRSEQP